MVVSRLDLGGGGELAEASGGCDQGRPRRRGGSLRDEMLLMAC